MRVGIIGCGAIGAELARAAGSMDGITGLSVFDIDPDAAAQLGDIPSLEVAADVEALVDASDLVVECANKAVVETTLRDALRAGKSVMVLTVGALANDDLRADLERLATTHGGKIYVPSGAVMGIDGLKAASAGGLKAVTLVTTKPNAGLGRAVDKWTLLFNGPAKQAVKEFPKNVNVAATLSLAGLGFDDTWVQVAVDPLANHNGHKVIIEGEFGRARIEVENLPSPDNPKTSHLASLSAVALLRRIVSPWQIGA